MYAKRIYITKKRKLTKPVKINQVDLKNLLILLSFLCHNVIIIYTVEEKVLY